MSEKSKLFLIKLKTSIRKFFLINDTPHEIAVGFALGVFLGIVPGEGITASLILSSIFGFNRLAATSGALATNMWSTVAILPLAAKIGTLISGENYQSLIFQFQNNYHLGYKFFLSKYVFFEIALPLAIGFTLAALIIAIIAYAIVWFLMENRKIPIHKTN